MSHTIITAWTTSTGRVEIVRVFLDDEGTARYWVDRRTALGSLIESEPFDNLIDALRRSREYREIPENADIFA